MYKVSLPKRLTPEMGGGVWGGGGWREQNVSNRCSQKPKRQTDVVTGDETLISFCDLLSKQKIKLWCGSIKPGTGQSST